MRDKIITRRDFLRLAAATPLAGPLVHGRGLKASGQSPENKVRVVLIRDEKALLSFKKPNPEVVQRMLDEAVMTLFGRDDPVEAWTTIIKPADVVGIKSNVWRYIPTTPEVEQAIKRRVMDAGVPAENISIDDRGVRRNRVFQRATALINARPARTHHWSGLGGCIKNPIMFVSNPPDYHGDSCADLARLWKEHNLIERTRLNVLVMLNPQFHSVGPHGYSDKFVWDYKGIIVSQDPVAADSMGLRIILNKRLEQFGQSVPLETPAKHIRLADTRHRLGVSDPAKIELVKLGWKEGILI